MVVKFDAVRVFAPAKINLTLHVVGQRPDGFHLLDSLVSFADVGDCLTLRSQKSDVMTATGPEAAAVPVDRRNLVLRVATLFDDLPSVSFELTKNLPVASGIGGGSADAAAAFRGLCFWLGEGRQHPELKQESIADRLLSLGADIPVCLPCQVTRMRGIGEDLDPQPYLPLLHAVLVNPRVAVATGDVFAALDSKSHAPMADRLPAFTGTLDFVSWLALQRNDLEPAAIRVQPVIADVLSRLKSDPACLLARMSGSGATCFGLFESHAKAALAARNLVGCRPDWWVRATSLGNMQALSLPRSGPN